MSDEPGIPVTYDGNPCAFKTDCRTCRAVRTENRPTGCISLKCQYYIPCKKCGRNTSLNTKGICEKCNGKVTNVAAHKSERIAERREGVQSLAGDDGVRKISLSRPGVPPKELRPEEADYYLARWEEFKGFYRDPASYFTVHCMILEEVHLHYIHQKTIETRGEAEGHYQKMKQISVQMLRDLKAQLPEKDSMEVSEDESCLAGIYKSWEAERGKRMIGRTSRILSAEAIALEPQLPFRVPLRETFLNLGYRIETIEEALEQFDITEKTVQDLMLLMGYKLKEKYALPFKNVYEEELNQDGMSELDVPIEPPM